MSIWQPDRIRARLATTAAPSATGAAEPFPRRAAVAIVLALEAGPQVLLMRRVQHPGDPWSGQISLPGGGREADDRDLLATAMRETREELDVDLGDAASPLGSLPPMQARARGRMLPMDVTPFVFALGKAVEPRPGDEAEEAFWLPLDRTAQGEFDATFRYRKDDGAVRELPSWDFEGRVVWGMTHRILSDLLARLG